MKADHYFDLENPRDLARLEHPQTALEGFWNEFKGRRVLKTSPTVARSE